MLFLVFIRLDTTISGASKQEGNEGGRLFKMLAKSFSKRYSIAKFHLPTLLQITTLVFLGEGSIICNFLSYLMHIVYECAPKGFQWLKYSV